MKKIRVVVIGLGRSGRDIHTSYLSSDPRRYRIVAVVDPIKLRRDRAKAEYGCEAFRDHAPLLEREDIDLVINATPSCFHVPISMEFLKAGFNVLCEKPLASRTKDVDRLMAAAKKSKAILAIFQQSRFAPFFCKAQEVIASGVLGEVVQVSIAYSGFSRRYDWQTLTEFMGGSLLNTGPHPLDMALQFFGTDAMPDVHCVMRSANNYGDADDHVNLTLSGPERRIVCVEISSCSAYPDFNLHVYATRGGLKGTQSGLEWRFYDPKAAPKLRLRRAPLADSAGNPVYCTDKLTWSTRRWQLPKSQKDQFQYMSRAFYAALHKTLTEGAPLVIPPMHVRQQIAVIEACQRQNPGIWG